MGNKDTFSPIVKERVLELLKADKKTQKEMATALDITPEHLSRCLKSGKISKTWLIAIADYLDVSVRYLTGELDIAINSLGEKRHNCIENQDQILSDLFTLLGFSENQYVSLTNAQRENLKTDLDFTIAFFLNKISGKDN